MFDTNDFNFQQFVPSQYELNYDGDWIHPWFYIAIEFSWKSTYKTFETRFYDIFKAEVFNCVIPLPSGTFQQREELVKIALHQLDPDIIRDCHLVEIISYEAEVKFWFVRPNTNHNTTGLGSFTLFNLIEC